MQFPPSRTVCARVTQSRAERARRALVRPHRAREEDCLGGDSSPHRCVIETIPRSPDGSRADMISHASATAPTCSTLLSFCKCGATP